jgi:hypothetical protein
MKKYFGISEYEVAVKSKNVALFMIDGKNTAIKSFLVSVT